MIDKKWKKFTKDLLKCELQKRGILYKELVELLADIGVKETYDSIESKMARGSFSGVFFIQVLKAIGCKSIKIQIEH
jgi:hypothetical protein